jgi:hypothetical protein
MEFEDRLRKRGMIAVTGRPGASPRVKVRWTVTIAVSAIFWTTEGGAAIWGL